MRMYDIILKKRDGGILTKEEIAYVVKGFTDGTIPDYQMSALLMAIYYQHMNYEETLNLTLEMAKSGDILDLSFKELRQTNILQEVLVIKQRWYLVLWWQQWA